MKVLVTGGAGYIGSHTVRQLVKSGADVTVLDSMVYGHEAAIVDKEVTLVKGDLGDPSVVYPLLVNGKFDAVVHFAAFIQVGESVTDPLKYYENNIAKPLVLLRAMMLYSSVFLLPIGRLRRAEYAHPTRYIQRCQRQNPRR